MSTTVSQLNGSHLPGFKKTKQTQTRQKELRFTNRRQRDHGKHFQMLFLNQESKRILLRESGHVHVEVLPIPNHTQVQF